MDRVLDRMLLCQQPLDGDSAALVAKRRVNPELK